MLAIITCSAQSLDTQIKSQHTANGSAVFLATAFNSGAYVTIININDFFYTINCHPQISHPALPDRSETYFIFQTYICHNLRHSYHPYLKHHKRNLQFSTRKISINLKSNKSSSKWLQQNKINFFHLQNSTLFHYQRPNDSAMVLLSKSHKNNETLIKDEMKTAKEEQRKYKDVIQNSYINNFFRNLHTNNYYNHKNVNYKTNINYNKISNQKNANANFNNYADKYSNESYDHYDDVYNDGYNDRDNLLPPVINRLLPFIHVQQHIDDNKLMKLVMSGLRLKKIPNMEKVNISQEEYVTKYRDYLQRLQRRKRQHLGDTIAENPEVLLRSVEIFSIVSNTTLLKQGRNFKRQKRNVIGLRRNKEEYDHHEEHGANENTNQSLEERIRNILFSKKNHQKPRSTKKEKDKRKTNIRLIFALKAEILNLSSSDIEEANIRFVFIHSPILAIRNYKNKKARAKPKSNTCGSKKNEGQKNLQRLNELNIKLFFLSSPSKRVLLDWRKINIPVDLTKPDETHTQWLQFDVTKAVKMFLDEKRLKHVTLELQCENCKHIGARILNDAYNTADEALAHDLLTQDHQLMPVLNIIGLSDQTKRSMRPHRSESYYNEENEEATTQRHYHHQTYNNNKNRHNRRTNCYKERQRCCRHSMEVTFKDIKGFEFIIQPKVFDAGYCHGRCPPRYNPANHHALLQSLIWKQNHRKAPRPCCAPSKLVELEVLHVDEKDSEKLKISTWSDMKVVECACS